jgi:hypothetical protein
MFQTLKFRDFFKIGFFIKHTITPTCSFQQDISNLVLHIPIGDHLTFVSWVSMANNQIATLILNHFFGHNS